MTVDDGRQEMRRWHIMHMRIVSIFVASWWSKARGKWDVSFICVSHLYRGVVLMAKTLCFNISEQQARLSATQSHRVSGPQLNDVLRWYNHYSMSGVWELRKQNVQHKLIAKLSILACSVANADRCLYGSWDRATTIICLKSITTAFLNT